MNILQFGNNNAIARGFNGAELKRQLLKQGLDAQHCVWEKASDDENTWQLIENSEFKKFIKFFAKHMEKNLSVQSLFYPFSWKLLFDKRFQKADIVHYQLIHTGFFSLLSLPALTFIKPSVWTLHDPWALTGHCVYPDYCQCEKWKTGCGKCVNLKTSISMDKDNTAFMWKIKKFIYKLSKIDIILASRWMFNKAKESPLLSGCRLHHIPFGLDLDLFRPENKEEAKRKMGVLPGRFVIGFRATDNEYKGLNYIKEALHRLNTRQKICLLTTDMRGLMDEFRGKYQIIDLGWIKDYKPLITAYNSCDLFITPSTAEAFGMMAMEAMACGKPLIIFEGTSLPEVTFAPEGAISVPMGDTEALKSEIEDLINNKNKRERLGEQALILAKEHYNIDTMVQRHIDLYKEVIKQRKAL